MINKWNYNLSIWLIDDVTDSMYPFWLPLTAVKIYLRSNFPTVYICLSNHHDLTASEMQRLISEIVLKLHSDLTLNFGTSLPFPALFLLTHPEHMPQINKEWNISLASFIHFTCGLANFMYVAGLGGSSFSVFCSLSLYESIIVHSFSCKKDWHTIITQKISRQYLFTGQMGP